MPTNGNGSVTEHNGESNGYFHVPMTVQEMKPPRPADIITEASNFIRSHWDEIRDDYMVISGEMPTQHGSMRWDWAATVFKVQKLAKENGFTLLGEADAYHLSRTLCYAFRRNTGMTMGQLKEQNKALRLTHQPV